MRLQAEPVFITMPNRDELFKSWDRTRAHLGRAAGLLPATPVESDTGARLDHYRELLEHNELELALEVLEGLGAMNTVPPEFWSHLRDAALEMGGLDEYVIRFDQRLAAPSLADIPEPLRRAHQHSSNHRSALFESSVCGCFYCGATYSPVEIVEWIDEDASGVGQTALCPKCGIDSVLGDRSGVPITPQFLAEMKQHWFS